MKKLIITVAVLLAFTSVSCITLPGRKKKKPELSANLELPDVEFAGDVYVDFQKKAADYPELAVLPFKAAVELSGASLSDFFTTELLKTSRYSLIERSQIENILGEQELNVSGVTDNSLAIQLGKVLGVKGVVIGTISEYGFQKVRISRAPSIGLSVRMIDTTTGKIVWSVSHSDVGDSKHSLSQHANLMIEDMLYALSKAWIDAGDTTASGLPPPEAASIKAGVRSVTLEWNPHISKVIAGYEILRKGPGEKVYRSIARLRKTSKGRMSYLDSKLLDLTLYSYEIKTVSRYGMVSAKAAQAQTITAGPPNPPGGLSAKEDMIRKVALSWIPSNDENVDGYIIMCHPPRGDPITLKRITKRSSSEYLDEGTGRRVLKDKQKYTYTIKSYNTAKVESKQSDPVTATTKAPPSPVKNVKATSGMPRSVTLNWLLNSGSEQIAGYFIYSSATKNEDFIKVGDTKETHAIQYTDKSSNVHKLKDNTTYYYRISAYNNGAVEGPQSQTVSATTKPAPQTVQGVKASQRLVKKVTLHWKPVSNKDVQSYSIYRSASISGNATKIGSVPAESTSFTDDNKLSDGATYIYKVSAVDIDALEGDLSNGAEGITKFPPEAPEGIECTPLSEAATITWIPNRNRKIAKYIVYYASRRRPKKIGETVETSFTVQRLRAGKTYSYSVAAVDEDGLCSAPSEAAQCTIPQVAR